ncbi:MAG: S8 family serine peptidase [Actinomycetota bacterium]
MKRAVLAAAVVAVVAAPLAAPARAAAEDPYSNRQWGLSQIGARDAWGVTRGRGAVVAIVDTGVDLGHPDLAANVLSYPDADMLEGGCPESSRAKGCVRDGAQDEDGHGTYVAGIVAAQSGNGIGIEGTAPQATVLPVRVTDPATGSGSAEQVARGIRYAADKGADVINLSLSYDPQGHLRARQGQLAVLHTALEHAWQKGAVVVVAAGNDSFPLCAEPTTAHALCVGATDRNGQRSWYSNSDTRATKTFVVAPGGDSFGGLAGITSAASALCAGDVFSTYLRSAETDCSPEQGYEALGGTSMATPFVSGVAALLSAQGLSNAEIVACIASTSDDLGAPGRDPIFGWGRVDAARAVTSC